MNWSGLSLVFDKSTFNNYNDFRFFVESIPNILSGFQSDNIVLQFATWIDRGVDFPDIGNNKLKDKLLGLYSSDYKTKFIFNLKEQAEDFKDCFTEGLEELTYWSTDLPEKVIYDSDDMCISLKIKNNLNIRR